MPLLAFFSCELKPRGASLHNMRLQHADEKWANNIPPAEAIMKLENRARQVQESTLDSLDLDFLLSSLTLLLFCVVDSLLIWHQGVKLSVFTSLKHSCMCRLCCIEFYASIFIQHFLLAKKCPCSASESHSGQRP